MDERFATPRAAALSSRSNCSSLYTARSHEGSDNATQSSNERWHTPRNTISSARSAASFATARSSLQSPIETVQVHRSYDAYSHASDRDRTRDFRRFDQANSYASRPVAEDASYTYQQNYDLAESGGVSRSRQTKIDNRIPQRGQRNQDIFSLARHGRVGELEELLLQGVSIESTDENGNSILSVGCQNGSKRVVKLALRYGADIDASNSSGNTALHFAFKYGFGESLGRYLISKGANTNVRNKEGRTYAEV
ncbi:hypothetical protein ACHAXN_013074 [Cyclotella atomus]